MPWEAGALPRPGCEIETDGVEGCEEAAGEEAAGEEAAEEEAAEEEEAAAELEGVEVGVADATAGADEEAGAE
jgi:hypothetical protein